MAYNSTNFKNQIDTLLADNTEGGISAADLRTVLYTALDGAGGMATYENSVATKQNVLANTWTKLEIDGLGAGSSEANLPYYITSPLVSNSTLDMSKLNDNSIIHYRTVLDVDTLANSQVIHLNLVAYNSSDVEIYRLSMGDYYFKTIGSYELATHTMFYGNPALLTAGNYAQIEARSADGNFDVLFKSSVLRIAG